MVVNYSTLYEQKVLSMSFGLGGTLLATAAGHGAHFFDVRTSAKMGVYADNHTDLVTQVRFNPCNETELATGSEDGLVCVYDTRQAHADASLQVRTGTVPSMYLFFFFFFFFSRSLAFSFSLILFYVCLTPLCASHVAALPSSLLTLLPSPLLSQCVINADCAVRRIGFFAPGGEGVFVLTGSETLGLWHKTTAQCLNPTNVDLPRQQLGCNYLVDCHFDASSGKLSVLAGDWAGNLTVAEVTDSAVAPTAHLRSGGGGHSAVVRAALWRGPSLVTGGEDARVCLWSSDPSVQPNSSPGKTAHNKGPGKNRGSGSGRSSNKQNREAGPY